MSIPGRGEGQFGHKMNEESNPLELAVLKSVFEKILTVVPLDISVSDSEFVRDAKNQLKVALLKAEHRCTCARRSYDMCEVCQGSPRELYYLRNFYRMLCNAKKNGLTNQQLHEFIENTKGWLSPQSKIGRRNRDKK